LTCVTGLTCTGCDSDEGCGLAINAYLSLSDAANSAICVCSPNADDWYALAGSGCSRGLSASAQGVTGLSLVADATNGAPTIAWADPSFGILVEYWRLNGKRWMPDGPTSGINAQNVGSRANAPALATDPTGLRLAWLQADANGTTQVFWALFNSGTNVWDGEGSNGNGWQTNDGASGGGGLSQLSGSSSAIAPAAAALAGGLPVAVWYRDDNSAIEAQSPTGSGSRWVDVESLTSNNQAGIVSANVTNPGQRASVAMSPSMQNTPWVAFADLNNIAIHVRAPIGAAGHPAWRDVSPASSPSGGISPQVAVAGPDIVFAKPSGVTTPVVAFASQEANPGPWSLYVRTLVGNTWKDLQSGSGAVVHNATAPALAAADNGDVFLAFEDQNTSPVQIGIYQWSANSLAWTLVGSHGLVSSGLGPAGRPAVSVVAPAPDGSAATAAVCVAWLEQRAGEQMQVYVRCRDL